MSVLSYDGRYSNRLNRVLNYVHRHDEKNLQLDSLADLACLSKYHFARVFQDVIGESPVSFLKRTRLEKAASMIKYEYDLPILEIALRCGFSNSQLFSRKFGDHFGLCPRQYRIDHRNRLEDQSGSGFIQSIHGIFDDICINNNVLISADIIDLVQLAPTQVAYVRSLGSYGGCDNIGKAEVDLENWALEHELCTESSSIIGISWDYSSITPSGMCRYDVCVPVPMDYVNNSGISLQTIPGGMYARARFPYSHFGELVSIWSWFYLMVASSDKFKNFKTDFTIGPWYEIYKPYCDDSGDVVELYAYLPPMGTNII